MRKLCLLLALAAPWFAAAQGDSATSAYVVDGVRVIHRRTNANIVAANLYLLGGVRQATAESAGLENFLLAASERGTKLYPRDALRRAMARTGSEIVVQPHEDWTVVGARTTVAELDSTWAILADRILQPTLDAADVEFVRELLLSGVRQRQDSPDATLDFLADSVTFAGHPYARSPVGDERSLARISVAELKEYHRTQLATSRMVLVVVGNVTRVKLETLVHTTLGRLPVGNYVWSLPDSLPSRPPDVAFARRALPTNYIQGYFAGPLANSRDVPALRVAAAVLSGRLFAEIRSRRNLTYAVSANLRDRGATAIGLYVTTTAPDTTIALMKTEVRALQSISLDTELLQPLVQQFITEYFLDNETITAQADFLARAQLYRGDFRAGERFVSELRKVTGTDVQRVARLYLRNIRWAYVGDPARVRRDRMLTF